jgi:hypothetical protein
MSPGSGRLWTTPADVVAAVRRRWDSGELLREQANGCWEPIRVGISGPTAREIADRFDEVRSWLRGWRSSATRHLRVEQRAVGGRHIGVNELPGAAWVDSVDQACHLLGVSAEAQAFDDVLAYTRARAPDLESWVTERPLRAVKSSSVWPSILDAVEWVAKVAPGTAYLREIDVPGVDTKFLERHKVVVGELLDRRLPADRIDVAHGRSDLARRYRLRRRPDYIRFRHLGEVGDGGFSELTVRVDELAARPLAASTVFVVENETTYLALPGHPEAVVVYGGGGALPFMERLPWLRERQVVYWGDLDTHGFAILSRLRARLPHTTSMLMDRATLLAHRDRWVTEATPTRGPLSFLDDGEGALFRDLVEDTYGQSVRLEQERIGFDAVRQAMRG